MSTQTAGLGSNTLRDLDDHELLLAGRRARIAENRASAERWSCFVEFYRRRVRTEQQKKAASPHFALTARQETVVEIGSLWGMDAARVRTELNVALFLSEHGEGIWRLCAGGHLDGYRATLVADAARQRLEAPGAVAAFMTRMLKFLRKHLTGVDGDPDAEPLVTCTVRQLRNAIDYTLRTVQPREDEQFRAAYAARTAYARDDVPGMGWLSINGRIDKVKLADHRLLLAARRKREQGDERTVAQLKADLALDLLAGKHDAAPVPTYARPIINLTVPIQTVMGLADDPGALSGGTPVPAGLARAIAADPDATWHRMLTDPAGQMVELSTTAYRPTAPIWRQVTAQWVSCFEPACHAPATQTELDHRIRWPQGQTRTGNLWPACKRGHTAKHTPGFSVEQTPDGSFALRTRAGFTHPVTPPAQPASDSWPDLPELPEPIQLCATELLDATAATRTSPRTTSWPGSTTPCPLP